MTTDQATATVTRTWTGTVRLRNAREHRALEHLWWWAKAPCATPFASRRSPSASTTGARSCATAPTGCPTTSPRSSSPQTSVSLPTPRRNQLCRQWTEVTREARENSTTDGFDATRFGRRVVTGIFEDFARRYGPAGRASASVPTRVEAALDRGEGRAHRLVRKPPRRRAPRAGPPGTAVLSPPAGPGRRHDSRHHPARPAPAPVPRPRPGAVRNPAHGRPSGPRAVRPLPESRRCRAGTAAVPGRRCRAGLSARYRTGVRCTGDAASQDVTLATAVAGVQGGPPRGSAIQLRSATNTGRGRRSLMW